MELTADELFGLKQVELDILKIFIKTCEQLHLRYYLIGGTLIGAIRHKGFIPWDDDIDVIMPRKDYYVFIEKGQKYLPKHLFIQTHVSDPEYQCCFAKVRNSRTTFVENSLQSRHINHGIYIDIFPLDYYPDNVMAKRLTNTKDLLLSASISRLNDSKPSRKMRIIQVIASCIYPSAIKAVDKRERFLKNQKSSSLVRNYCGAWGLSEIWRAEWFEAGVKVDFEGIEAMAPSNYDAVLRKVYGDYMKLPPAEKQISHHFCKYFDLEQSYKKYV